VETTSRLAALNLMKHAGMIGMLPRTILAEAVEQGGVRLPVGLPDLPSQYGPVVRRGAPSSAHALEFKSIIRAQHSDRTRQRPGPVGN
jgi:DNA-binding transcriptional LysR family regulator